jgi:hypothetical protein
VTIPAVTVNDVAGNISTPQPPQGVFGPFEVDKKAPAITGPTMVPASPIFGQSVSGNYSCADGGSGVVLCGPTGSAQIPPTANTGPLSSPADSTVGTHIFSVNSQDLVGNASPASAVTYTVSKATPVVVWPAPAPIVYGTLLSAVQLDATANVPGTFVYNPAMGTVLPPGSQTLSVTFTPSDVVDYNVVSQQVTLLVTQPQISFAPPSLNFGTVKMRSTSTIVVVVSNPGTASLNITGIALSGRNEDNDLFQIANNCKSAVAPGGTCTFSVTFSAKELGTYAFTILVTDNAAGSPQHIPLTATVVRH